MFHSGMLGHFDLCYLMFDDHISWHMHKSVDKQWTVEFYIDVS